MNLESVVDYVMAIISWANHGLTVSTRQMLDDDILVAEVEVTA